jgi:hypothetical protein
MGSGLVDPIYYHHGIDNFNTWSRGRTVIDYIFVSEDILDSVNTCGYHPFNDIILSDHRAVIILCRLLCTLERLLSICKGIATTESTL